MNGFQVKSDSMLKFQLSSDSVSVSVVTIERQTREVANEELQNELEELSDRLRKAEQVANESQAEAAVYRELLEDLYKAADQAISDNNVSRLYEITRKLTFNWMPSESQAKLWGKYFLHAYVRHADWLEYVKQSLERIRSDAERLDATDKPANAELKQRILDAVEDGLVPHI